MAKQVASFATSTSGRNLVPEAAVDEFQRHRRQASEALADVPLWDGHAWQSLVITALAGGYDDAKTDAAVAGCQQWLQGACTRLTGLKEALGEAWVYTGEARAMLSKVECLQVAINRSWVRQLALQVRRFDGDITKATAHMLAVALAGSESKASDSPPSRHEALEVAAMAHLAVGRAMGDVEAPRQKLVEVQAKYGPKRDEVKRLMISASAEERARGKQDREALVKWLYEEAQGATASMERTESEGALAVAAGYAKLDAWLQTTLRQWVQ